MTDTSDRSSTVPKERGKRPTVGRRAETFWSWLKITARLWGFLGVILLVLFVFRAVIAPFIVGLLVAYVLAPALEWITQIRVFDRNIPRGIAIVPLYVVVLGLVGLFFTSFVPRIGEDITRIVKVTPRVAATVRNVWVPKIAAWAEENIGAESGATQSHHRTKRGERASKDKKGSAGAQIRWKADADGVRTLEPLRFEIEDRGNGHWIVSSLYPDQGLGTPKHGEYESRSSAVEFGGAVNRYLEDLVATSQSKVQRLVKMGQHFIIGVMRAITGFILVLMISVFLLLDADRILKWLRNLMPTTYYQDFDNVVILIDRALGGAIRGQLIICVVNGVLTGIGLVLIGVKYSLLLALFAGIMSLIPIFGSILSSIPIVLVALASGTGGVDIVTGVLALTWIIGIHLIEANVLNPNILGVAARIHPLVVVFSVVAGQQSYGATGALLAVPIVSAAQAMFVYLHSRTSPVATEPGG